MEEKNKKITDGEKIRIARKRKGITQAELGRRMGVTQQTVNQYESGKIKAKIETLKRIADALEVPLSEVTERVAHPTYFRRNKMIGEKEKRMKKMLGEIPEEKLTEEELDLLDWLAEWGTSVTERLSGIFRKCREEGRGKDEREAEAGDRGNGRNG